MDDRDQSPLPDAITVLDEVDRVRLVEPAIPDPERYQIDREIGRGGMGVVQLIRDRRIGRSIARKLMRADHASDAEARARFLREVQVQGQLEHPAIVPVYDLDEGGGGAPSFTMKTIRGRTLHEIIAALRTGEPDAARQYTRHKLLTAFGGVCLAIDYAHQRGVLHRDLKPSNLMLGDFGEVYVLDWGIAKITGNAQSESGMIATSGGELETEHGSFVGTPGYLAPDVLRGKPASVASDVFALGAVLFELLVYEPLIARGSTTDVIARTLRGDVDTEDRCAAAGVPPELAAICARALSNEPGERHASARALYETLERFLAGERDVALRKQRSVEQCAVAKHEAALALEGGENALEHRRRAMAAVNHALASDPDNREAMDILVSIISSPPAVSPPEVQREMQRQYRRSMRSMAGLGTGVYMALLGFLPLTLWMGVREPLAVAAIFVCIAIPGVLSLIVARSDALPDHVVVITAAVSTVGLALTSRVFGPFVLLPAAIAVNSTAFAFFVERRTRMVVLALGCLGVIVPVLLELFGSSPSYVFSAGGFFVEPRALTLPRGPTFALLTIASLSSIVLGCLIVGILRDRVLEAERRMMMYTWHLREFVPPDARGATDPRPVG